MLNLTPEQRSEYLARSYAAVDGLWFMKVEEELGFDKALELDDRVWQVMPKIQARKMKSFAGVDRGLAALRDCFEAKLTMDGFTFTSETEGPGLTIAVTRCPWYDKMVSSKRTHLAAAVGRRICMTEYSGWAGEFGCSFSFGGPERVCEGCRTCLLRFQEPARAD